MCQRKFVYSRKISGSRSARKSREFEVYGIFFNLVIGVIAGFLASNIASYKGHNATSWFFAGFLLGPLGLIAAAGLSDKKLRKYIRQIGEKQDAIPLEKEDKPVPVSGEMFEV